MNDDKFKVFLASAFGLGLSPIAPGTCGALLGVAGHVLIAKLLPVESQVLALSCFFVIVCVAHFSLTPWAVNYWKCKDPQHFVLDEVAGYLMVPIFYRGGSLWYAVVVGFTLFRVFDIVKLPIARQIDRRMHGAWGILLDDLVSAGYAILCLVLIDQRLISFRS